MFETAAAAPPNQVLQAPTISMNMQASKAPIAAHACADDYPEPESKLFSPPSEKANPPAT